MTNEDNGKAINGNNDNNKNNNKRASSLEVTLTLGSWGEDVYRLSGTLTKGSRIHIWCLAFMANKTMHTPPEPNSDKTTKDKVHKLFIWRRRKKKKEKTTTQDA